MSQSHANSSTGADEQRLLGGLLRGVSRSFYLTLRVLPGGVRRPVGLAYLLARAADTIVDSTLVSPDLRLACLLKFREQIKGPSEVAVLRSIEAGIAGGVAGNVQGGYDRELLASLPQAFAMLETTPEPDRAMVRDVVITLTHGMEFDLETFPPEDANRIAVLQDFAALDTYTYYVAGCVGEFWTSISMTHTPALGKWDTAAMKENSVRFGKALQLTNILRDVPKDLRIGRCYLPESWLSATGLAPTDLLQLSYVSAARPVLYAGIGKALEHFTAAEEYVLAIPGRCLRLRLAALWPVLLGLSTLSRLARNDGWLDVDKPSRVNRSWVYRMMVRSWPSATSDTLLKRWIRALRREVEASLPARENAATLGDLM